MKKYPVMSSKKPRPQNTSAKCRCGKVAKYRPEIQVNYFRGDDEVVWACEYHIGDVDYLLLPPITA